jgi:hypothetical protein
LKIPVGLRKARTIPHAENRQMVARLEAELKAAETRVGTKKSVTQCCFRIFDVVTLVAFLKELPGPATPGKCQKRYSFKDAFQS